MVTNLTNLTQVTNIYDIVKFNYDVTQGIFGDMLVLTLFFILLMMFIKNYSLSESMLASSFLVFCISLFLRMINLIAFRDVMILGIIIFLSGSWVYYEKK